MIHPKRVLRGISRSSPADDVDAAMQPPSVSSYDVVEVDDSLTEVRPESVQQAVEVRPHRDNGGIEAMIEVLQSMHEVEQTSGGQDVTPAHSFETRYALDENGERVLTLQYVPGSAATAGQLRRQVQDNYPQSLVETREPDFLLPSPGQYLSGAELALRKYTLYPIRNIELEGFRSDPTGAIFSEIVGAQRDAADDADVTVQVMFQPAPRSWRAGVSNGFGPADSDDENVTGAIGINQLSNNLTEPSYERVRRVFTTERVEYPPTKVDKRVAGLLEEQQGSKGWELCIRVFAVSDNPSVARSRASKVAGMFRNFYESNSEQTFIPQPFASGELTAAYRQGVQREMDETGMVKSQTEMAGLVNIPESEHVSTNKIRWSMVNPGEGVPPGTPRNDTGHERGSAEDEVAMLDGSEFGDPFWFGYGAKYDIEVGLPANLLDAHMFIAGRTRYGKTTLSEHFFGQVVDRGGGALMIDPKGRDADDFLREWPDDRPEEELIVMDLGQSPDGSGYEKIPRFNFMEIPPGFDPDSRFTASLIEALADDIKAMVAQSGGSDNYVGALMKRVTKTVCRGLLKSGRGVSLLDLACAVSSIDGLEEFSRWMSEDRIAFVRETARRFEEKEDTDLEPLAGRMDEWIHNDAIRDLIAARDPTFSIHEAVEEGKVVVVRFAEGAGDTERRLLSTALIRRTYASKRVCDNEDPFYLLCDEFDKIATEASNLHQILSEAGGHNYRCVLACQAPDDQLPDRLRAAVGNQIDTFLTFNPGAENANYVAKHHTVDAETLRQMDRFTCYFRMHDTESYLFDAFEPVREVRERATGETPMADDEIEALKERSMDRYGQKVASAAEQQASSPFYDDTAEADESDDEPSGFEESDEQPVQVVKAAYDEWLRREHKNEEDQQNGDGERWVPVEKPTTRKRVARYLPTVDVSHVSLLWHVIDHVPDDLLEVSERDGEMFMRCTEKGKNRIFETGSASSAGGGKHRTLLKDGYKPLFETGMVVSLPTQAGDDMPDGVGDLSDVMMLDFDIDEHTHRDIRNVSQQFEHQYPLLNRFAVPEDANPATVQRTDGPAVAIEAESSTGDSKPAQSLFNFAQAYNKGQRCLFTCRERVAETLWQTLTENGYYSHQWDGEHERCYNGGELVLDDMMMLRPEGARQTVWLHDEESGEYILRDSDGEEYARFESAEAVFTEPQKYPANSEVVPDDQRDDWVPVYRPFTPDYHFERGVSPAAWDIVVVPEGADQPADLRLYRGPESEQVPLTEVLDEEQSASVGGNESDTGADTGAPSETTSTEDGELSDEQRDQIEEESDDEDSDGPTLPGHIEL